MALVTKFRNEQTRVLRDEDGYEITVSCGTLSATDAMRMQLQLQNMMGPGLAALAGAASGADIQAMMLNQNVMFGITKLAKDMHLHEADLQDAMKKFAAKTQFSVNGSDFALLDYPGTNKANGFDEVFSGHHDLVWQWLAFHLELNLKDFLDYVKSALKELEPADKNKETLASQQ